MYKLRSESVGKRVTHTHTNQSISQPSDFQLEGKAPGRSYITSNIQGSKVGAKKVRAALGQRCPNP